MPTSLFMEGILGVESLSEFSEKFIGTEMPVSRSRFRRGWIWLLLLCITAAGVGWYFFNMQNNSVSATLLVKDTRSGGSWIRKVRVRSQRRPLAVKLPDGTVFKCL